LPSGSAAQPRIGLIKWSFRPPPFSVASHFLSTIYRLFCSELYYSPYTEGSAVHRLESLFRLPS
jgi:hypothetical protein